MADEPRNYVPCWRDGSPKGAVVLLSAATSTGAGTTFVLPKAYSAIGLEYFRATTSTSAESTKANVTVQARLGSTNWHTLGTALAVNSATPAVARSTNSIPFTEIRATITTFTTSAGSATTSENRIATSVYATFGSGSS